MPVPGSQTAEAPALGAPVLIVGAGPAGADGARSRLLGQAGLTVEGPEDLARAANIWFRADMLEQALGLTGR